MKKYVHLFAMCLIVSFLFSFNVQAHPGNTDKYGGHYDKSTGIYHFHNDGSINTNTINDNKQNNETTTSTSSDAKFWEKPLSENVKSMDKSTLESLYIENMTYYENETKKLEEQINTINNEKNDINFKYTTLQDGFVNEKNKNLEYENLINTYKQNNLNLMKQRNISIIIAVILFAGTFVYFKRKRA